MRKYKPLILLLLVVLSGLCRSAAHAQDTLCAVVQIEIEQTLTLERQAFDARMAITNHLDTIALENVAVNVVFSDENGNSALATTDPNDTDASFFIRIDSMTGVNDVAGAGTIAPAATAEVNWLIIPAPGAGGAIPSGKRYDVGATLTFTQNGEAEQIAVAPDVIFVKPLPKLALDYFLTENVYADDPLTPQIEPTEPFTLGVRVKNTGGGPANKVKIDTAQPEIVENEQGLPIDFRITGAQVDDEAVTRSLLINLGDIAANEARVGRWQMETTLSGRFTDFNATFTHADELGGVLTSLLDPPSTHSLIRDVRVDLPGRDSVRDFLAKDADVLRVYESDTVDTVVADQSASASLTAAGGERYTLTMPVTPGFAYAQLSDPYSGSKVLIDAVRSDGKRVPLDNAWLSKIRFNGGPWNYFVNLFDVDTAPSYTLVFADPALGEQPPVLQFIPDRLTAVDNPLNFLVEASDPNGTVPMVSVEPLPPGASFLQESADGIARYVFSWTPVENQNGPYGLTFTASDGLLEANQTATLRVTSANDSDGDGMDDAWELAYFGSLDRDGTGDFDGDGVLDLDEFRDGTDPGTTGGSTLTLVTDLPEGVLGQVYLATLSVSGGTAPYSFELINPQTNGELPPGLALSGSGELAGAPTQIGVYAFDVRVVDANNASLSERLGITVTSGTLRTIGESGRLSLTDARRTIRLSRAYSDPVVFVSAPSANEAESAVVRVTDVSRDRFTVFMQESVGAASGGHHRPETVIWLVLEAGSWQLADGSELEVGAYQSAATVGAQVGGADWHSVGFDALFGATPVVISQVQTANVGGLVKTRQSDISATGALIALEGDEAQTQPHGSERVGWLALEPGTGLWDGYQLEAATHPLAVTNDPLPLPFAQSFVGSPGVFASISSYVEPDGAALRQADISDEQVSLYIDEDTAFDSETAHAAETVNVFAIEGTGLLSAAPLAASFNSRPTASFFTADGVAVGERQFDASSSSDEDGSVEQYSWSFGDGATASGVTVDHSYVVPGAYDVTLTVTDDQGLDHSVGETVLVGTGTAVSMGEIGVVEVSDSAARIVTLQRRYNNPVIFARAIAGSGAPSSTAPVVRVSQVLADAFTVDVVEASTDNPLFPVSIDWFAFEAGQWLLPDGTRLDVGTVDVETGVGNNVNPEQWTDVLFGSHFSHTPVVLSQVQSFNDPHFVAVRQRQPGIDGVQFALSEDEAQTESHGTETVGWLAMDAGRGDWNGASFEAGLTPFAVTDTVYALEFDPAFAVTPGLVTGLASYADRDNAVLRINPTSLSPQRVEFSVAEDLSFDAETTHAPEAVAYLALSGSDAFRAEPTSSDFNAPPLASFSASTISGDAPLTVSLDASPSSDDDGSIDSYQWSFGDGSQASGVAVSHTFTVAGTYSVLLTVRDNLGAMDTAAVTITVVGANQSAPSVSWLSPQDGASIPQGVDVTLTAAANDDGAITKVEFFSGAMKLGEDSEAPYEIVWQAASPGDYVFVALASDDQGLSTESAALSLTVYPPTNNSREVVLQDGVGGYQGTRDAYLSRYQQTLRLGSSSELRDQRNNYNSLVGFAIFQSEGGPVPDGATIESATLALYKNSFYSQTYRAHRILGAWDESTVDWLERQPGTPWSIAGAESLGVDFQAVADAEASVAFQPGWLALDVTGSVQAMSEGSGNNGWRLVAVSGNYQVRRFASREYTDDTALRPKLSIVYQLPGVALTSPSPGSIFQADETIALAAEVPNSGSIAKVEFFADGTKIGEDTTVPYSASWSNAVPGAYSIAAVALESSGQQTASPGVQITVVGNNAVTTVVLQDGVAGYQGARDAYLSRYQQTLNFGGNAELRDQRSNYHALLGFAIFQSEGGPVPDGATIESATLRLYKSSLYTQTYRVHRMLDSWDELSVNWQEREAGVAWSEPGAQGSGADFEATADAEGAIGFDPGWLELDVTGGLQNMSSSGQNHGWRLVAVSGNYQVRRFASGEATVDDTLRPRLTVSFSLD